MRMMTLTRINAFVCRLVELPQIDGHLPLEYIKDSLLWQEKPLFAVPITDCLTFVKP